VLCRGWGRQGGPRAQGRAHTAPEEETLMTKARQRERKRRRHAELNEAIRRGRQAELQKDEEVFNMLLEARFGRKDRYAGWELDAVPRNSTSGSGARTQCAIPAARSEARNGGRDGILGRCNDTPALCGRLHDAGPEPDHSGGCLSGSCRPPPRPTVEQ
jgi:hypothetical protein